MEQTNFGLDVIKPVNNEIKVNKILFENQQQIYAVI